MYIAYDNERVIRAISNKPFKATGQHILTIPTEIPKDEWPAYIGKRLIDSADPKPLKDLRVAFIVNWNDKCGISTYSNYLVSSLKQKIKELHVFSEINGTEPEAGVTYCWRRGESMRPTIEKVLEWKPDFVIIQHEYGLFPNAFYYMQMMQMLDRVPHAVVMHSVYEHLDKAICTGITKNIIVHNDAAKKLLKKLGNDGDIYVVPHGCVVFEDVKELWNAFRNPYTVVQFGFGFYYKGMDRAIDALHHLKTTDEKFKNIFYCCLISTNEHNSTIHDDYHKFLVDKIEKLGMQDNVTIHRKFFSDEVLNYFLRTAKIAIFPYRVDPNNTVYGASGAIRIAMANGIPVIASESHLFDDLEGVISRPKDHLELAKEIDEIFSNDNYRNALKHRQQQFIHDNTWDKVADKYLDVYNHVWRVMTKNCVKLG